VGSNAQSSLIQFFDIVLGVEHRPTGTSRNDSDKGSLSLRLVPVGRCSTPRTMSKNWMSELWALLPPPYHMSSTTAYALT
jgi:hypothetical protein